MRMDSEMIGILLSDSMHYTIVVSLEMSDEPFFLCFTPQIPPSHQSRDKPWQRIHYVHEPQPRDIPPSAAL